MTVRLFSRHVLTGHALIESSSSCGMCQYCIGEDKVTQV